MAQRLKRLTPMQETRVQSLGEEDPQRSFSNLVWEISWTEEASGVYGVSESGTQLTD